MTPDLTTHQPPPLFTIAVTTYDRVDLLRETLASVLKQEFSNFEIIVGNDNPGRTLDFVSLGIEPDPRVQFINRTTNLRELANMNDLLQRARGRYFTWLADDDLYRPQFLKSVADVFEDHPDTTCVLTSFSAGEFPTTPEFACVEKPKFFSGANFFRSYWSGEVQTVSVMGVFLTSYLRELGGLEDVSRDNLGMFCEYMLLVRMALLERIAYIDTPLIFYRQHAASWSNTTQDIDQYLRASEYLVTVSIPVFLKLDAHFSANLSDVMIFAVKRCIGLTFRRDDWTYANLLRILGRFSNFTGALHGTHREWDGRIALLRVKFWGFVSILWFSFKKMAPSRLVAWAALYRDKNIKGFVK